MGYADQGTTGIGSTHPIEATEKDRGEVHAQTDYIDNDVANQQQLLRELETQLSPILNAGHEEKEGNVPTPLDALISPHADRLRDLSRALNHNNGRLRDLIDRLEV